MYVLLRHLSCFVTLYEALVGMYMVRHLKSNYTKKKIIRHVKTLQMQWLTFLLRHLLSINGALGGLRHTVFG